MNNYLALTIGPIYETFAQAKRTRAVWAASYFFSYFIKQLTFRTKVAGFKILMPYSGSNPVAAGVVPDYKDITYQSEFGSGLYADRIYFEPNEKTKIELEKIVADLIGEIADIIKPKDNPSEKTTGKKKAESFLKQYLNVHILEAAIDNKESVLNTLNDLLDQQELRQNYMFEMDSNYLLDFFESKDVSKSKLADDAFGPDRNNGERKFLSIPEIATTTLYRTGDKNDYNRSLHKDFKNEDTDLLDELKKNKFKILPYHKYYAVLYADGDNIGTLLKKVSGDFDALKEFSNQLLCFGLKAEKAIANYGGNGIYLGGEDILAFLPMACIKEDGSRSQTIFNVVQSLDDCFAETIGAYAITKEVDPPTLSFGIALSYLKHPLKESMHEAHYLMDEVAKKRPCKNSIGLRFEKHSGQRMECCIEKSKTCSWNYIKAFVEEYTKDISNETETKTKADLLSGVIHRMKDEVFFTVFCAAAREPKYEGVDAVKSPKTVEFGLVAKEKRLVPFFENFFDEKVHQGDDNPKNIFLQKVRELTEKVFDDYPNDDKTCRDIIHTVLRFIHFINSTRE